MSNTIASNLEKGGDLHVCGLWILHRDMLNQYFENRSKNRNKKVPAHLVILNWAIAFLAKTSSRTYKEVASIMLLPDISYVYRKIRELVLRYSDKSYSLHLATLGSICDRVKKEGWTEYQQTGCIG